MSAAESSTPPIQIEERVPGLRHEGLLDCIHCGICLSTCPTYDLLRTEADSPRGRLYYMRALAEGRQEPSPALVRHLDGCLGCRACETACPSAVHYGEFLTFTRAHLEERHPRSPRERRLRALLLNLLERPRLLALALAPLRIPGARALARLGARALLGPAAPAPPVPERLWPARLPEITPAQGERRARVGFLAGCVMPLLYHRVNRATLRVLAANGCEVVTPQTEGCCGALSMHVGALERARARARRVIETFAELRLDALLTNSAGCGSALKEYPLLFPEGDPWRKRAEALAAQARDVSEFLVELGPRPPERPVRRRVTYHDACHHAHGQGVRTQPRELLRLIPGLELAEAEEADWCCGSAGIYNFLQPAIARRLQQRKVENLLATGAEAVVTGNPGCHAWIETGLAQRAADPRVLHTMELLAEAYGEDGETE